MRKDGDNRNCQGVLDVWVGCVGDDKDAALKSWVGWRCFYNRCEWGG